MMARQKPQQAPRTEPAHGLLHEPRAIPAVIKATDTRALLELVAPSLRDPFNLQQERAFSAAFTERSSLLWGPPGTGKTTVLAASILGWLERAWAEGVPVCIGVGSSNYNAIDKVLKEVKELLDFRTARIGAPPSNPAFLRLRSDSTLPLGVSGIEDVSRGGLDAPAFAGRLSAPVRPVVIGGTWMQLAKLARAASPDGMPVARWFDLLVIDEASQVPVATAAAYYLLLKADANVVHAGDHRQLGPIYGFDARDKSSGLFDCIFTYLQETHGLEPVQLERNYRTNIEISTWPKLRFYSRGYEAFHPTRRLSLSLPESTGTPPVGWPAAFPWTDALLRILDPTRPVTVVQYGGDTSTVSNPFEAQQVAALTALYRLLLRADSPGLSDAGFWEQRLGIVTPHRAQMAQIRNLLVERAGIPMDPMPVVDTVDRFQGQERDMIVASYAVADPDFVASEEEFILDPRRFNVTLTRARSKFVMFVSDAVVQHLPSDAEVAKKAAHLQLFVENYCGSAVDWVALPYVEADGIHMRRCRLRTSLLGD